MPVDLDWATTSGRAISASSRSKGAAPGADTTIGYLTRQFLHTDQSILSEMRLFTFY